MVARIQIQLSLIMLLSAVAACSLVTGDSPLTRFNSESKSRLLDTATPASSSTAAPARNATQTPGPTPSQPPTATSTATLAPTPTEVVFALGQELTIEYLRDYDIHGSEITFEQELTPFVTHQRYIVSYLSEGNKIFGLLAVPTGDPPEHGFPAIVFNHGYIPPAIYRTTERYEAYVNYLARNGFVVFKIDYRGHGQSEGEASGSYFSPGYTIDSIAALKSLQTLDFVNPAGIGMWGHSMAGNVTLRAMLVEPEVKAGVIWAGAVYSYADFAQHGINDNTYRPRPTPEGTQRPRRSRQIFETYGRPDLNSDYWRAVSLTENIEHLRAPVQIHHAANDAVVSIAYSEGLVSALQSAGKEYEFYTYEGGGHNLISPYFTQAMQRTVAFFRDHLSTGDPK